jgi:hypothetical protein
MLTKGIPDSLENCVVKDPENSSGGTKKGLQIKNRWCPADPRQHHRRDKGGFVGNISDQKAVGFFSTTGSQQFASLTSSMGNRDAQEENEGFYLHTRELDVDARVVGMHSSSQATSSSKDGCFGVADMSRPCLLSMHYESGLPCNNCFNVTICKPSCLLRSVLEHHILLPVVILSLQNLGSWRVAHSHQPGIKEVLAM